MHFKSVRVLPKLLAVSALAAIGAAQAPVSPVERFVPPVKSEPPQQLPDLPLRNIPRHTVQRLDGGSVVTNLGYNIQVNAGSSLNRIGFVLNDATSPAMLQNTGIVTRYADRGYSFIPVGAFLAKSPITAIEVRFALFDVFGERLTTASFLRVRDYTANNLHQINEASWYASESDVRSFFAWVAFVARVRLENGSVWEFEPGSVVKALSEVKLKVNAAALERSAPGDRK